MIRQLLVSPAFRQTILSTLVVLIAISGFAVAALISIDSYARADLLHTIDTDIAGLVDVMVQGGGDELRRRIDDRSSMVPERDARSYYQLSDPTGRPIAGELPLAKVADPQASLSTEIMVGTDKVLVRATRLRGGLTLVVGRSLGPLLEMERRLRWSFTAAALAAMLISLTLGLAAARQLLVRVTRLNEVFDRFASGLRVPRRQRRNGGDEIDLLATNVENHLDRIEELLLAQREITDNIAHELRTPLAHLDTRLLRALDRNKDEEVAEILDDARADIKSVVSLFDALLDIAMALPPETQSNQTLIDLSELCANIGELYAASAEEAGFDFSTRIAPAIMMRGEPMQMTRLVANLLDNAMKYVPSGSQVRLSVSAGPRLVVEDNGPGIQLADRETVFKRFRRSTTAGRVVGEGHGLGLALVRLIAARHGLVAYVEDAEPGARFVIAPGGSS